MLLGARGMGMLEHLCRGVAIGRRRVALVASLSLLSAAVSAGDDWKGISSWVYQLQNYKDGKLDEIAASKHDLAVVDLARDGGTGYFTKKEIEAVKRSGKKILSYFEIGAIEKYRPEWKDVPKDLLVGTVGGWPDERFVKFWDERWWKILKARLDRSIDAGFDGAYLDIVTAYEEIPLEKLGPNPPGRKELAARMAALIIRVAEYAEKRKPGYKIFPQNCPELFSGDVLDGELKKAYRKAIDGIGLESVFFMAMDKPAEADWCAEYRAAAAEIAKAGKIVLGVDYCVKPENVAESRKKMRKLGFVPFESVEELDRCPPAAENGKRKADGK